MADSNISISKLKSEMNKTVINYLRESETSGNTPTEEQFHQLGERLVNNIGIDYRHLNQDDLNDLKSTMTNYFETEMVSKYKRSLRDHPRQVNGHWPTQVSDEKYKNFSKTLKDEKTALIKDIKYLIKESERTNRTPTTAQAISWLTGRMEKDLSAWGDEQGRRYVSSYIDAWLEDEYTKRMSQSQRNHPRQENGHWPWKTNEEEQRDATSGNNRDKLIGTQNSGVFSGIFSKSNFATDYMKSYESFSGYDMVCTVELPMPKGGTYTQVIGELQTVTYSIFNKKGPVRCLGDMNAKGYVFGPRTIAGTLIFTVFDRHWTSRMEKEYLADAGITAHMLADELPPFNLTISCANEYGHDAVCSIFGITLVNEGQVMSINDVFTENTYNFYATDVQYLAPVEVTMGGIKNPTSCLPQISKIPTVPEKPPVIPRPDKPPIICRLPNIDPDKPKKQNPIEPPVPIITEGDYRERLAELEAQLQQAIEQYEKEAEKNGHPPAWVRIMRQRATEIFRRKKEELDRLYKNTRTKGVLV